MRQNLPIIDHEFPFPEGASLVSTTDLKGRILYCNSAFVSVSGYERQELLGQPHNMIRHPDMPEEAFRDMWATIERGLPWTGLVKNRRKDGTYYWVVANVTPLLEGDRPVGYMSVRTCPTRAQVEAATALYATMRDEAASGKLLHVVERGHVRRTNLAGRFGTLMQWGLNTKVTVASVAIGVLGYGGGAMTASMLGLEGGWSIGLAALVAAGVGALGATMVSRVSVAPLAQLLAFANRMAAGDLTQSLDIKRTDLIGDLERALNQLNVNLMAVVRDARSEVVHVRDASREIAAGNLDLSERTESQASSLEQTAASMEQITGNVRSSADAAGSAASLAEQTTDVTRRSDDAVKQVMETMQAIQQSSHRIGEIIQVIDGIAFQTNILALNAAVEAARAGEQGRGFAVVAGEVRALAQRTTAAAKEVKHLIAQSAESIEQGSRRTDAARQTMVDVLSMVERVGQTVGQIDTAGREQLSGITQVNEAVAHIDGITQQNAAMVEQMAASAAQLRDRAEVLEDAVSVFRTSSTDTMQRSAVELRKQAKQAAQGQAAKDRVPA